MASLTWRMNCWLPDNPLIGLPFSPPRPIRADPSLGVGQGLCGSDCSALSRLKRGGTVCCTASDPVQASAETRWSRPIFRSGAPIGRLGPAKNGAIMLEDGVSEDAQVWRERAEQLQ